MSLSKERELVRQFSVIPAFSGIQEVLQVGLFYIGTIAGFPLPGGVKSAAGSNGIALGGGPASGTPDTAALHIPTGRREATIEREDLANAGVQKAAMRSAHPGWPRCH